MNKSEEPASSSKLKKKSDVEDWWSTTAGELSSRLMHFGEKKHLTRLRKTVKAVARNKEIAEELARRFPTNSAAEKRRLHAAIAALAIRKKLYVRGRARLDEDTAALAQWLEDKTFDLGHKTHEWRKQERDVYIAHLPLLLALHERKNASVQ
ncbi:MAG TPA: hypothetical protein VHD55_01800 [Candidatus Paceibacterota bacterium]|nr:hypothetical protein [Candidatus Paceibacterota bacterium]